MKNMTIDCDDFKKAAHDTFEGLKALFQNPACNVNWRLGHSFDTIVDYLVSAPHDAPGFGKIALDKYKSIRNDWYDDYGWWSIATLKAGQHQELFSDFYYEFQSIAHKCWESIDKASGVWTRADKSKFAALQPLFDGGVWNSDWDPNGSCSPLKPDDTLCGYQNTVTNGLYLVSSTRLFEFLKQDAYGKAAEREYQFLKAWFYLASVDSDPLLNYYDRDDPDKAVVRERVTRYASSGTKMYSYRPTLAWAGDQGLILGGLVDRMLIVKDSRDRQEMLRFAKAILAGVREYLTVDGILLPWWPDPAPGGDRDDYRTGTGVFMRYLLYAYQRNADLKTYLQQNYQDFVRENAEHVIQSPSSKTGDPNKIMITLTNDLATLVAAIGILCP